MRRYSHTVNSMIAAAAACLLILGASSVGANAEGLALRDAVAKELGPVQEALRQAFPSSFGGLYVQQDGTPMIEVVGPDPRIVTLVSGYPLSVEPVFEPAAYSETELDALHAWVRDRADDSFSIDGVSLAAIETDIINNRVNVYVVGPTADDLDRLVKDMKPGIVVIQASGYAGANACSKSNCPNPLKGALWLYQSSTFWCMSGFVFRHPATGKYYLSTAGHCSTIGDTYQHPSGTNIGQVTHQGWVDQSTADVSLIQIASSKKSNLIMDSNTSTRAMTSREDPASNEVIGEGACASKKTTTNCGSLISVNNTISICEGACHTITHMRRASVSSVGGDSGSPVYYGFKAIGIISASYPGAPGDSLYSHVRNVELKWSMVTQITP